MRWMSKSRSIGSSTRSISLPSGSRAVTLRALFTGHGDQKTPVVAGHDRLSVQADPAAGRGLADQQAALQGFTRECDLSGFRSHSAGR